MALLARGHIFKQRQDWLHTHVSACHRTDENNLGRTALSTRGKYWTHMQNLYSFALYCVFDLPKILLSQIVLFIPLGGWAGRHAYNMYTVWRRAPESKNLREKFTL